MKNFLRKILFIATALVNLAAWSLFPLVVQALQVTPSTGTYTVGQVVTVNVIANNTNPANGAVLWLTVTNATITNFTVADFTGGGGFVVHENCNGTAYFNSTTICVAYSGTITSGSVLGIITMTMGSAGTVTVVKPTNDAYINQITATPDPAVPTVGAGTIEPTLEPFNTIYPEYGTAATYTISAAPSNTIPVTLAATATISELPNTGGQNAYGVNFTLVGSLFISGGILLTLSTKLQKKFS
ncbi:MAG: hypothetical protein WCJ58_02380 [bacterium]